jgi:hypothetical protein
VRAEVDQERLVTVSAEDDAQVVIHAERLVVGQLALQLVRPEDGVLGIAPETAIGPWCGSPASGARGSDD